MSNFSFFIIKKSSQNNTFENQFNTRYIMPIFQAPVVKKHIGNLDLLWDLFIQTNGIQNQIASTDAMIDEMVYGLYGLNKEEITIVEESNI